MTWTPDPAPTAGGPLDPATYMYVTASFALSPQGPLDIPNWAVNAQGGRSLTDDVRIYVQYTKQQAIYVAAFNHYGKSDAGFIPAGTDCAVGCVYTVNGLIYMATGEWLCGSSAEDNVDTIKSCPQLAQVSDGSQGAGDLIIADSADGVDGHVGICLDAGCDQMNSNASSGWNGGGKCEFNFDAPYFQYPNSPYNDASFTYWRAQ